MSLLASLLPNSLTIMIIYAIENWLVSFKQCCWNQEMLTRFLICIKVYSRVRTGESTLYDLTRHRHVGFHGCHGTCTNCAPSVPLVVGSSILPLQHVNTLKSPLGKMKKGCSVVISTHNNFTLHTHMNLGPTA